MCPCRKALQLIKEASLEIAVGQQLSEVISTAALI